MKINLTISAIALGMASVAGIGASSASAANVDFSVTASSPGTQTVSTGFGASNLTTSSTVYNNPGSTSFTASGGGTISGGASGTNPGWSTNPFSGITSAGSYVYASGGASPSSVTFSFNQPQSYFGFLWGSLDTKAESGANDTNTVTFLNSSGTVVGQFTGDWLEANTAARQYPAPASYANFAVVNANADFTKVVLSDNYWPFETANYASVSSVPLPGALPLFGSALVGIGAFVRRRAKKVA